MGLTKQRQLEDMGEESARLDREFARQRPDLVAEGWDREMWEAYLWAQEKND